MDDVPDSREIFCLVPANAFSSRECLEPDPIQLNPHEPGRLVFLFINVTADCEALRLNVRLACGIASLFC